jgi:Leucine-rich repeat (LRR) protein
MYNEIQEIPPGSFQGLSSLETLDFTGNQLTVIPAGLFDPLVNLKRLYVCNGT